MAFSSHSKAPGDFETGDTKKSGPPSAAPHPSSSRAGAPWSRVHVSAGGSCTWGTAGVEGAGNSFLYPPVMTQLMLVLSRRLGPTRSSLPGMFSIRNLNRPVVSWQVPRIDKAFLFSFPCKRYQELFRRKLTWVISFCLFVPLQDSWVLKAGNMT